MTDPIADFLTRLRNGLLARHKQVVCPSSKLKLRMAHILKDEGYVGDVDEQQEGGRRMLRISLRYDEKNAPLIEGIERVSKPGLRLYASVDELPKVRGGLGMAIVSTS
jgi:small subunit ribosomal protein S8